VVEQGLISSLARPGGNLTGLEMEDVGELAAKRIQLLKEALPATGRVAVLTMGADPDPRLERVQQLLGSTGVRVVPIVADSDKLLDAAFAGMTRDRPDGIYPRGAFFYGH